MSKITMSSPSSDGLFVIHKATAFIRGRERKTRTLQFITSDGFIGESRRHDRTEARHAAMAKRAAASMSAAVAVPKAPMNAAAMLPHNMPESMLIDALLARGYDVSVPTAEDLAIRERNDARALELDGSTYRPDFAADLGADLIADLRNEGILIGG